MQQLQDTYNVIPEAIEQQDKTKTTNFNTEKYKDNIETIDKNLSTRQIAIDNKVAINSWFQQQDIELANQLISQLQGQAINQENNLSNIQAFLQLHKLAKSEYKKLFIEQWQYNTHKFILSGYCELISPLDLTQNDNNIESLSVKIKTILKNWETHKDVDNTLLTLIMLIEKRLIEGECYLPDKYQFSISDLPKDLPKQGEIIEDPYADTEEHHKFWKENHKGIIPNVATNVEIKLNDSNVGTLRNDTSKYIFLKGKNFNGRSIKLNYNVNNKCSIPVTIDLNNIQTIENNNNVSMELFYYGKLLLLLLKQDHHLSFDYLLNSEYFIQNIQYNEGKPHRRYKSTDMFSIENSYIGDAIWHYICHKKPKDLKKLLAKGAKVTRYIIRDLMEQIQTINLSVATPKELQPLDHFFLLLDKIDSSIFKFNHVCFLNKKNIQLLLDYIIDYLPEKQHLPLVSTILRLITNYNIRNDETYIKIIDILREEKLKHYLEKYNLISDIFLNYILTRIKYSEVLKNILFSDEVLDIIFDITQKKFELLAANFNIKGYYLEYCLLNRNSNFIHLIFMGVSSKNIVVSGKAKKVYETYLSLAKIQNFFENSQFTILFGDFEKNPLWCKEFYSDAANYILIERNLVMLLSANSLEKFLDTTNKYQFIDWKKFLLFNKNGDNLSNNHFSLNVIYNIYFSYFKKNFFAYMTKNLLFNTFIKSLYLGEYENFLTTSLALQITNNAFINNQQERTISHDYALLTLLNKHISIKNEEINGITNKNLASIKQIFHLENQNNIKISQTLVCIAYVFVKYSSDEFFGSHFNSPFSVRAYASALLTEAYKIDKKAFPKDENESYTEIYTNWQNILMGKTFSCTHILSNIMLNHIKINYDEDMLSKIIPVNFL
jgi:hypothetical protein